MTFFSLVKINRFFYTNVHSKGVFFIPRHARQFDAEPTIIGHIFTKIFHGVEIRMLLIKFAYPIEFLGKKLIFRKIKLKGPI